MTISAGDFFVFTLVIVIVPVFVFLAYMHRWFQYVRISIEEKIDKALILQSGQLQNEINILKTEVNELKKDIRILRQLAAFVNRAPLPEHMTEGL